MNSKLKASEASESQHIPFQRVEELLNEFYPNIETPDITEFLQSISVSKDFIHSPLIFFLNFSSKGYEYVSANVSELFDVTAEELKNEGLVKGIKLFPPEYWKIFVNDLLPEILTQFHRSASIGMDLKRMKVHYNIPMYNRRQELGNTMHLMKPVILDNAGMPLLAIKYIFDISDFSKDTGVKLVFEYPNQQNVYELFYSKTFLPEMQYIISKREEEIINLIGQGLSSKTIADKLCISIHTVNTHRKNIMKKYNIQNFQQFYYTTK